MHMNGNRLAALALGMASGLVHAETAAACDDIAILARDGRYIVASADDLVEKDVGNLWWLGIRAIDDVVSRSTVQRAGVLVELRIDLSTGEAHQAELAVLRDLGRSLPPGTVTVPTIANDFQSAWWVDDSSEGALAVARGREGGTSVALYSADLEKLGDDISLPVALGNGISCTDDDRLIVGALRHRVMVSDGTVMIDALPSTPAREYRALGVPPAGCTTLIGTPVALPGAEAGSDTELVVRAVDLATNDAGPEFRKSRASAVVLFAGGARLFEQDLDATREGEIGFRMTPTGRVRVIDVETGGVVRSAELTGAGKTSRVFCRDDKERLVMAAQGEIHLVDLASLSIVASRQVPFESYVVF